MKEFFIKYYSKLIESLVNVRKDLCAHFALSAFIYIFLFNILFIFMSPQASMLISTVVTLLLGTIKEYYIDKYVMNSVADKYDLYADLAGTVVGIILSVPLFFA